MHSGDGGDNGTPVQQHQQRVQLGGVDRREDLQAEFRHYQERLLQAYGPLSSRNGPPVPKDGLAASTSVQPNV